MNERQAAVAGYFYPADETSLLDEVDQFICPEKPRQRAVAAIMPHAGYMYSGAVAGQVVSRVEIPNRVIVLCPKHTRAGGPGAVSRVENWVFPFGRVPVDVDLAERLVADTPLGFDDAAHRDEHSLEVEIPFLWRVNPSIRITPVALGFQRLEVLEEIGLGIAAAVARLDEPVLIVASTDMSHQIPLDEAKQKDQLAINRILDLDPTGLFQTVIAENISMCGVIPVTTALFAAGRLGASDAELIRYATSADATGDTSRVVGYAGMALWSRADSR